MSARQTMRLKTRTARGYRSEGACDALIGAAARWDLGPPRVAQTPLIDDAMVRVLVSGTTSGQRIDAGTFSGGSPGARPLPGVSPRATAAGADSRVTPAAA